jgi:hypothetical protein
MELVGWFGLIWGLVWFGLVWFGLVWFGLVSWSVSWLVQNIPPQKQQCKSV